MPIQATLPAGGMAIFTMEVRGNLEVKIEKEVKVVLPRDNQAISPPCLWGAINWGSNYCPVALNENQYRQLVNRGRLIATVAEPVFDANGKFFRLVASSTGRVTVEAIIIALRVNASDGIFCLEVGENGRWLKKFTKTSMLPSPLEYSEGLICFTSPPKNVIVRLVRRIDGEETVNTQTEIELPR